MNEYFLTILIPTRNRPSYVEILLKKFSDILENSSYRSEIEIIVADNFSEPGLEDIVLEAAKHCRNIKYKKHLKLRQTAESSMAHAVNFCNGQYVWCFGDDDTPEADCFETIMPILKLKIYCFLLLNMRLNLKNSKVINYINATSIITKYKTGLELFQDFGLISATTTLSCLLFKKNEFLIETFNEYVNESEVYSHSFSLLDMFYDKPCAFISTPVLIYTQNSAEEEVDRFGKVYGKLFPSYPFTTGLIDLVRKLSDNINISINTILLFNEVEISKDSWAVCQQNLGSFFLNHTLNQLTQWCNDFESCNKNSVNNLLDTIIFLARESTKIPVGFIEFIEISFKTNQQSNFLPREVSQTISWWRRSINDFFRENPLFVDVSQFSHRPVILYFDKGGPLKLLSGETGDDDLISIRNGDDKINLSILIPSFNRDKELKKTLHALSILGEFFKNQIEVVIALNACNDNSQKISHVYADKFSFIKVVYHHHFVNSAEENISRSIALCKGEYIWTLGDDDYVSPEAFILLNHLVKHIKNVPAILFNHAIPNGKDFSTQRHVKALDMQSNENFTRKKFQDLVRTHGLTTSMAFISRYVIHRNYICNFDDYTKISPIYSHVFFFIKMLYNKKILWIDYPLVVRHDSIVANRITNLSDNLNTNKFHFWSGGILKLYFKLCKDIPINKGFLFDINEFQGKQTYKLFLEVFQNIIRQYEFYLNNSDCQKPVFMDIILYKIISYYAPAPVRNKVSYLLAELTNIDVLINEMLLIDAGKIFQLREHLSRLSNINLGVSFPPSISERKTVSLKFRNTIYVQLKRLRAIFRYVSRTEKLKRYLIKLFPPPIQY